MDEPLVCQSFVGTSIALGLDKKNQGHTQAAFGGAKRSEQMGAGPDASGAGYNVVPACPAKNRESGSSATGPEDPAGRGRNMILCWLGGPAVLSASSLPQRRHRVHLQLEAQAKHPSGHGH